MRLTSTRAAAFALLVLSAACGGDGPGTPPTEPGGTGDFTMTLMRAANSQIPALADSALVRIWNTTNNVNALKAVAIPAPGATSQVNFSLPSGSGYSVGVVAYRFNSVGIGREGFAAGVTHNVTILADQANQAAVNVLPLSLTMSGPDTLRAGTTATYTFVFSDPALAHEEMLGQNYFVRVRNTPWTSDSEFIPSMGAHGRVPGGFTAEFPAPTVDADSAVYVQPRARTGSQWPTGEGGPVHFFVPSLSRGQALFRIPVKPATGSITIVFNRDAPLR